MNREKFIEMISTQYFTVEEGRNIPDRKFEDFPLEKTQMFIEMKNDISRNALADYLSEERSKDNWSFLIEEFSGCLLQMLSTTPLIENVNAIEIETIEKMYYRMLNGLYEVTSMSTFQEEIAKKPYVEHMEELRLFLMTFMDIDSLKMIND